MPASPDEATAAGGPLRLASLYAKGVNGDFTTEVTYHITGK
jgi:hypothetical protein